MYILLGSDATLKLIE